MAKFQLIFPSLSGSDKQISWAKSIRTTMVNAFINNSAGGMSNFVECMSEEPCSNPVLKNSINYVIQDSHASFWINNKNSSFNELLKTEFERNLSFSSK